MSISFHSGLYTMPVAIEIGGILINICGLKLETPVTYPYDKNLEGFGYVKTKISPIKQHHHLYF